jgi:hypothetical protein
LHARGNGILQNPEDFQAVFDRLASLDIDHYLIHFTGIHYENGNARYRLPIKKGDLKFEPLCEVILENNISATIISTSPIMEHDAMYMNIVFDRVKERRDARIARELREAQEKAIKDKEAEEKRVRDAEEKAIKDAAEAKQKAEDDARKKKEAEEKAKAKAIADEAARLKAAEEFMAKVDIIQSTPTKRQQVQYGDYKLYKKGNRYQFMKAKKEAYSVVFKVPEGKVVEENTQGVPILRDPPQFRTPKVTQSDESGRRQVLVDEYKLYKKENRYYFMKEKKAGFSLVFKVPDDKMVAYNKNAVPLLRAKED